MPLFLTVAFLHPHFMNFHSTLDIINGEQVIWDLGAMYADKMLDKRRGIIAHEIRKYIRNSLSSIKRKGFSS